MMPLMHRGMSSKLADRASLCLSLTLTVAIYRMGYLRIVISLPVRYSLIGHWECKFYAAVGSVRQALCDV